MMNYTDEQVAQVKWCDISLCGISWIEDGRDVVLNFLLPQSDRSLRLTCQWVRGLKATLEFGSNTGGYALSWDGEVKRNDDGAWSMAFDFASAGQISLTCQDLEFFYDGTEPESRP